MARPISNFRYWKRKQETAKYYNFTCIKCQCKIDNIRDCVIDAKQIYPIYPGKTHTPDQWRMYGSDILAYIHNDLWFGEIKDKCVLLCKDCGKQWKNILLKQEYSHIDEWCINNEESRVQLEQVNDNEYISIPKNEFIAMRNNIAMMCKGLINMHTHMNEFIDVLDYLLDNDEDEIQECDI